MLNRIRDSFTNPGALIAYRKDSAFKAIGYMLFFAIFMSVSMFIMVLNFDGVSASARRNIMNNLTPLTTNCEISNAELNCDEETQHTFYTMGTVTFSINTTPSQNTEDYPLNTIHFIIQQDELLMYGRSLFGPMSMAIPIEDLDPAIHNFDLNTLETNPSEFEYTVFLAVDDLIQQYKASWGTVYVLSSIVSGLILFLVFILLNTFLTRVRVPMIPFKQLFVLMTYAGTALYVVLIFNSLWNFNFIILIILLLIAFRQMNRMSLEIQARVNRNNP